MKRKHRKTALIAGIAALFVAPLIVYAIVYRSTVRTNSFAPGNVEIQVKENQEQSSELEKTLTLDPETHAVDKQVQIADTRTGDGEALRVFFVPIWTDANGDVCGSVFNFTAPAMNAEETELVYTDGDRSITLKLHDDWKESGWTYDADSGYFYYSGALLSGDLTPMLLERVVLNDAAYALTEANSLQIDVLADAVQTSGNAKEDRNW